MLAWIIDGIIYLVLSVALSAMIGGAEFKTYDLTGSGMTGTMFCDRWNASHTGAVGCFSGTDTATTYTGGGHGALIFLLLFVVFCVLQGALGGSLGKLVTGLRIVKADGSKAGIGASFVRTFLWIIDAITCMIPIVGLVMIMTTKGHRRTGDMVAGTFVVPKAQVGHPLYIPGLTSTSPYGAPQPYSTMPGSYPGSYGAPGPYGAQPTPPQVAYPPYGSSQNLGGPTAAPYNPGPQNETYEADKPTWDAKRNTYIQYDSSKSAWLEFDQATQAWKPISQ